MSSVVARWRRIASIRAPAISLPTRARPDPAPTGCCWPRSPTSTTRAPASWANVREMPHLGDIEQSGLVDDDGGAGLDGPLLAPYHRDQLIDSNPLGTKIAAERDRHLPRRGRRDDLAAIAAEDVGHRRQGGRFAAAGRPLDYDDLALCRRRVGQRGGLGRAGGRLAIRCQGAHQLADLDLTGELGPGGIKFGVRHPGLGVDRLRPPFGLHDLAIRQQSADGGILTAP